MATARASVPGLSVSSPPYTARGSAQPRAPVPPSARGAPRPLRRPGVIGAVHVGQIVSWQAAAVMVAAAAGRHMFVVGFAVVVAGILLGFTGLRFRHRWLYQWTGIWLRYLLRERESPGDPRVDPRIELLDFVAPRARIEGVETEGLSFGTIEHLSGATAVLELASAEGLLSERSITLPSPATLLPTDADSPLLNLQLIVHTTPAPAVDVGNSAPALSYRQLTEGRVPARRRTWIAVQIVRIAGAYSEEDLRQALTSAVRRLIRRLKHEGVPARPLDRAEVIGVLGIVGHVESTDTEAIAAAAAAAEGRTVDLRAFLPAGQSRFNRRGGSRVARESWSDWWADQTPQACFAVRRWPDLGSPSGRGFLSQMAGVPCLATTVSLAVRRARPGATSAQRDVAIETTVRVAATSPASLAAVSRTLTERARASGARLERLNGRQALGVAATLPLGGFLR